MEVEMESIKKRRPFSTAPIGQLYDSRYSPVQSIQQIHSQIKKKKLEELKKLKEAEKKRQKELEIYQGKWTRFLWKIWNKTFAQVGEDWVILAILGIFIAIISYSIDKGVMMCNKGQMYLYSELSEGMFTKWVAWICIPVCLILWDVGLTHFLAPQAAGSGIPQIKTSLRGVFMKEVLTFRVLLVKWLGIAATLGSGVPLGKEGPLIHMSSIIVTKLSKAISSFNKIYVNESKKIEMLGAAWAVGVACTFNAPIGGVLFSVEITTAYYAVRNYWRGFFAAVWGATTYRLLLVWIDGVKTISVIFKANFFVDFPYDPWELISFGILGLICGLGGSFYIWCKQVFTHWSGNSDFIKKLKKTNYFIYPFCVIMIISTITWPPGIGQFLASDIPGGAQVIGLFSNFTWTERNHTVQEQEVLRHWTTKWTGVYTSLVFLGSILASSMPIPNGSFIPNFRAGAALGRIAGELVHAWFPLGAAAFSGAVTHTMSVCVILFEMTSSITYVIPVLIAVLIANGVARFLTPSIYDLVIQSKKLPYLPDLLPNTSSIYDVYVEDFMVTDVKFVYLGMTYSEVKELLMTHKKMKVFPLVDHPQNMTLLGSIPRHELILLLDRKIGVQKRRNFIPSPHVRRRRDTIKPIDDSSDSDTEETKTDEKKQEAKSPIEKPQESDKYREVESEDKRERIFKKWASGRRKKESSPIPLSPMPERRPMSAVSMTYLEVYNTRICDLPLTEQQAWEEKQLKHQIDFTTCRIDPAPFQLVERTSLLKVHSLFSMLAINFAYVTSIGRLVGVVSLKELRQAIEDANSGNPPKRASREQTNNTFTTSSFNGKSTDHAVTIPKEKA
nr:unnamed protein product [Callosobruchus chinensis]